jgi:hypothetical protein
MVSLEGAVDDNASQCVNWMKEHMLDDPPVAMPPPGREGLDEDVRCPECEYNLRGLTVPRCPECGLPFDWSDIARFRTYPGVGLQLTRTDITLFIAVGLAMLIMAVLSMG